MLRKNRECRLGAVSAAFQASFVPWRERRARGTRRMQDPAASVHGCGVWDGKMGALSSRPSRVKEP
ncbi:unnamed protein product, partial [Ectocarpus sp. 6 AP-2014]